MAEGAGQAVPQVERRAQHMMTLYERTLEGVKRFPRQLRGSMVDTDGGACWLGTLITGADIESLGHLRTMYHLPDTRCRCPLCPEYYGAVWLGVHLNDKHGWSREAISLYLSSLAESEAPAPEPVAEEVTV